MTDRPLDSHSDIDILLRTTLRDDLPSDVEALLNDRVETFLANRPRMTRSPLTGVADWLAAVPAWIAAWPVGRALRAATAATLVACGIVLHAAGGPSVFAASVARVRESAAVWKAISRAASMRCTGAARDDLGSPARFADRVYQHWVLVASGVDATGSVLVLTYRSPGDGAQYELVVDPKSMLPRRVVKTVLGGITPPDVVAAGYDAGCSWETQIPGERGHEHE
jgi:hypothetical protein